MGAICWGAVAVAAVPSMLPEGRGFKLVWSDEFEGTALDTSKWNFRTNFWGKRANWFAAPEDNAVTVKDGCAHLRIVKRPDGSYCSAHEPGRYIVHAFHYNGCGPEYKCFNAQKAPYTPMLANARGLVRPSEV